MKTPHRSGYYMPAEWNKHKATWLAWPKHPDTFPPEIIESVENIYTTMISELSKGEEVDLLVDDSGTKEKVLNLVTAKKPDLRNVRIYLIKSADVWIRDYGPSFLLHRKSKKLGCTKWIFNSWGNKYEDLLPDNETGEKIARISEATIFRPEIVMEGGASKSTEVEPFS